MLKVSLVNVLSLILLAVTLVVIKTVNSAQVHRIVNAVAKVKQPVGLAAVRLARRVQMQQKVLAVLLQM